MTGTSRLSVTIIGGGASGVLLAAHLLRDSETDIRVTLVERRGQVGQGVAYSAHSRDHKLNVPARGMSAFADDPDHFWRWLQHRGYPSPAGSWVFVPRRLYGAYLEDVLRAAGELRPGRLTVVHDEVIAVRSGHDGMETVLANGTSLASHAVVLAVGHETQPSRGRGIAVRVGSEQDTVLAPNAEVMILGSGLSMVDAWLSLSEAQHRGRIAVVSRNGLLPKGHKDVPPITIDAADVPFGKAPTHFTRWLRALVAEAEAAGGDWRSVVDGLRPYNQRIWQSWSDVARRQFLRHLRPWWNIHRHRLPPELHDRLADAVARGQVTLMAGEFCAISRKGEAVLAQVRPRGGTARQDLAVARVYDCGGVSVDVSSSSNPVVRDLVAMGRARADRLHIGLDVDEHCQVIDQHGASSTRLMAIGPLTRGRFFEIEAIPDIRLQAGAVARQILGQ